MDTIVPRRRGKSLLLACGVALALGAALIAGWNALPRGFQVRAADLDVASAERGIFRDEIVVRAGAEPLDSIVLDSVESGRVEAVLVRDGERVERGQLLFQISNPQRTLELLARQAEHAQQIYNLSNLRLAREAERGVRQRRLDDLLFQLESARRQLARTERLATQGFVSPMALEDARELVRKHAQAVKVEQDGAAAEEKVRGDALGQLAAATGSLRSGIKLVQGSVDALAVRAPMAGRLTDFRLQVGESIVTGKHVGRIDNPDRFKLTARIEEFYLDRIAVGGACIVRHDGRDYAARIASVYPQVKEGRFTAELHFAGHQPLALRPGQSLDVRLTLGKSEPALLLPSGPYLNDGGGAWVYVVDTDGSHAERRAIAIGRRSGEQVEVRSGLAPGERVIVSGYAAFGQSTSLAISK